MDAVERALLRGGERVCGEPAQLRDVVRCGHGSAAVTRASQRRFSVETAPSPEPYRVHERAQEAARLDLEAGLLAQLAAERILGVLALVDEPAEDVPLPSSGGRARRPIRTRPSAAVTIALAVGIECA